MTAVLMSLDVTFKVLGPERDGDRTANGPQQPQPLGEE
jgi:hypothetical protein